MYRATVVCLGHIMYIIKIYGFVDNLRGREKYLCGLYINISHKLAFLY